jgi:low affinity Fe/Cu permease
MLKILILPILSSVLLAAHFSRIQMDWLAIIVLLFPLILLVKRRWVLRIYQVYLIAGAIIWIERLLYLRSIRIDDGQPWIRLSIILGAVAVITLLSAFFLQNKKVKSAYQSQRKQLNK